MVKKRKLSPAYQRRMDRGAAKGLTRDVARGHPKHTHRRSNVTPKSDAKLEIAVRLMNEGWSLTKAARAAHMSPERLRTFIEANKLARRTKRGWVMKDARTRCVQIISGTKSKTIHVRGFRAASEVGQHAAACRKAIETGDFSPVFAFRGKGVTDARGRFHPFETDPNSLYRHATRDEPEFHEIYQIVAT